MPVRIDNVGKSTAEVSDIVSALAWLQASNQTLLTGDKSGSFDLTTTGLITSGGLLLTDDLHFSGVANRVLNVYDLLHGPGGDLTISAGGSLTADFAGGNLILNAGTVVAGTGTAGIIQLNAADAAAGSNNNGGNIILTAGAKAGTGTQGDIRQYCNILFVSRMLKATEPAAGGGGIGNDFYVSGGDADAASNADGGDLILSGGDKDGTGTDGIIIMQNAVTMDSTLTVTGAITGSNLSGTNTGDQNDHGTLVGLGDDDHTIYPLLAGRAGGQTLTGGTGDTDVLMLVASTNANQNSQKIELRLKSTNDPIIVVASLGVGMGVNNIDYRLNVQSKADLGNVTFTGVLDDMTVDIQFTGTEDTDYKVEIDAAAVPDTFKWSDDGGANWNATGVAITGAAQDLNNGVTVTFDNTTGHTLADNWTWTVTIQHPFGLKNLAGNDVFTVDNSGAISAYNNLNFSSGGNRNIGINQAVAGGGNSLNITAGNAAAASGLAGGNIVLSGGAGDGAGATGRIYFGANSFIDTTNNRLSIGTTVSNKALNIFSVTAPWIGIQTGNNSVVCAFEFLNADSALIGNFTASQNANYFAITKTGAGTIRFRINSQDQLYMADGVLYPVTTNDIDIGTSSLLIKDFWQTGRHHFRDYTIYIDSATDGHLDLTADIAIDINAPLVYAPSAAQVIDAVGDTILANATMIVLDPDADYTMTSAPTIADGVVGQILYITCANGEANTVTVQDQDTLANSNLQLGAASRAITAKKVLQLIFDGIDWLEVAYANN